VILTYFRYCSLFDKIPHMILHHSFFNNMIIQYLYLLKYNFITIRCLYITLF